MAFAVLGLIHVMAHKTARKKQPSKRNQPHHSARETVPPEPVTPDIEADPGEGGQSGDLQGVAGMPGADSESVRELLEEGQAYEAGIVSGVENAPPADSGEVRVKRTSKDDVPLEYAHNRDEPQE